jgi:hypothetical protein
MSAIRKVLTDCQAPLETKVHSTTMTAIVCTPNYVLPAARLVYDYYKFHNSQNAVDLTVSLIAVYFRITN